MSSSLVDILGGSGAAVLCLSLIIAGILILAVKLKLKKEINPNVRMPLSDSNILCVCINLCVRS